MSLEPSYVGAYWGSRRESAAEAGDRLARCVSSLASYDPVLGAWFKRGASKAAAKIPVGLDAAALGELFAKGRNRRDFGGEVIEELGFSIGLWNRARPAVGLSAKVGAYTTLPGILNSFVLELPALDGESASLYRPGTATAIFQAVVDAWEPDWATWTTHRLRNSQAPAPREPVIGWFTYLRDGAVGSSMSDISQPLGAGVVVRTATEFAEVDEGAVARSRQRLQRASALRPIP